jgi:MazG family protein
MDPTAGQRPIDRLLAIMARLRDPDGGCPWDREQTFATIAPYTIEEAYEVADAVARGDIADLREELGDLLLQVVFQAQIASEDGHFGFEDVAQGIADKLISRHPHVFAQARYETAAEQNAAWEAAKAAERAAKGKDKGPASVLDDVPLGMPGLMRADKLMKRAARVGFDWPDAQGVLDKVVEEAREVLEVVEAGGDPDRLEDEIGDLLSNIVNLARKVGVDPEAAMRRFNGKFERRFRHIEARLAETGRTPEVASFEEMDRLWSEAKQIDRDAHADRAPREVSGA